MGHPLTLIAAIFSDDAVAEPGCGSTRPAQLATIVMANEDKLRGEHHPTMIAFLPPLREMSCTKRSRLFDHGADMVRVRISLFARFHHSRWLLRSENAHS